MPTLSITTGNKAGEQFEFRKSIVVGRGPMADLNLLDPTVSRRHAMINWFENECVLLDLDSENGTFVNDAPVTGPLRLRDGDRIRWGSVVAKYDENGVGEEKRETHISSASIRLVDAEDDQSRVLVSMSMEEAELERLEPKTNVEARVLESRRLAYFQDLAAAASQTFDATTVLTFVLDRMFSLLPQTERAFIMRWSDSAQSLELVCARTRDGESDQPPASQTLLKDVIEKREGILVIDVTVDPRYAKAKSMVATHLRTAICVPMVFNNEIFGVIQVDSTKSGAPFAKNDLALLLGVAGQIGMTLAYSKLHEKLVEREILEHDVLLARKIQQHFLPEESFSSNGCKVAFDYSPAMAVGGDFYDFLDLGEGWVGIAVGDVSGKGVSAALYMAKVASEMRYHSVGLREPAEILRRLNKSLARNPPEGMFITLALLCFHPQDGLLLVANAGHLLPVVREADGGLVELGKSGDLPLGVSEGSTFRQFEYEIEDLDRVALYTDGITDAVNSRGEMFGEERVRERVRKSDGTVSGTMESVLTGLKEYVGDAPQADDITFVCFGTE
jgi:serine phosphatase RsbU (regulator of sigma subunit)